jgi:putative transposase
MKRKSEHFSIYRIATVLSTAAGDSVGEPRISERTFCGRRRRHAGLPYRERKELKQLQNENTRLKKLVTQLKLNKSILQNVAKLCSASKLSS